MTDVDRVNLGRTPLQQAIGESAGRRADIESDLVTTIDLEMRERAFEFQAAASTKRLRRNGELRFRADRMRGLFGHPSIDGRPRQP